MKRLLRTTVQLLALVALAGIPGLSGVSSRAYTVQTVEVSEAGFNPSVCRMNREYVRFKNVGSTPRRVIRPSLFPTEPHVFDSGVLQPGETSTEYVLTHGGSVEFYDAEDPSHFVTVITPVFVSYWEPICTPDPAYVPPQPPCRKNPFCLRLPVLASD